MTRKRLTPGTGRREEAHAKNAKGAKSAKKNHLLAIFAPLAFFA
jgi:hypothetical protein